LTEKVAKVAGRLEYDIKKIENTQLKQSSAFVNEAINLMTSCLSAVNVLVNVIIKDNNMKQPYMSLAHKMTM